MLIQQVFELRGPGPPGRTCTPITGYFHDKTIAKENLGVNYDLLLKYCSRQYIYLTSPYLGQITYKIEFQNARF